MNENVSPTPPTRSVDKWEQLFDAALREGDVGVRRMRLQFAKDAIMDRIEDSLGTISGQDSRLLLAALNTISEFQRMVKNDDLCRSLPARTFDRAE